jgi:hypothetical protein
VEDEGHDWDHLMMAIRAGQEVKVLVRDRRDQRGH